MERETLENAREALEDLVQGGGGYDEMFAQEMEKTDDDQPKDLIGSANNKPFDGIHNEWKATERKIQFWLR